ncbi:MAG: alpha/beta hydrolase [Rubrivivax sp.]|nr:alpha/beta hydrolase [Rubrivivax sp.]
MIRLALFLAAVVATASPSFVAAQAAEQAIDLATPTGTLRGTLTLPPGAAGVPVVLVIAGSGPTDRDGNTPLAAGRNDSLKMLAAALADLGLASVRYDKRGVAASSAAARAESELRFDHYVDDAAAWVGQLARDPRFTGVAVLGHSEGSLIGMLAVQRSPAAAFVSVAGPATKAADLLRRQLQGRLPPDLAAHSDEILGALEAGRTVDDVPAPLMVLYRPSVQPYLVSWFRQSPAEAIAALRMPCLVVQGGTDLQVGVADARALQAANPACRLEIADGMNHVLKTVPPDPREQLASYGDPARPLDAGFAQALARFLSAPPTRAALGAR